MRKLSLRLACGAMALAALAACTDDETSPPDAGGGGAGGEGTGTTTVTTSSGTTTTGQGGGEQQVAYIEIEAEGFCNFSCFQLAVGEERQLTAKVVGFDGEELDLPVTWSSDDEAVATVDTSGVATGLGEGEVTVRASAGGKSGEAVLTIVPATIVTVEVTPSSVVLPAVGDTQLFTAVAKDENGVVVPDAPIAWSTANPGVASVGSSGLLTSSAQGHVVVFASSGFAAGWAEVTVVSPLSADQPWALSGLTGGGTHACGIDAAAKAYCWGWNFFGQLGNGDVGDQFGNEPRPVAVASNATFSALSTGLYHTCGLTTAGQAYCWGQGAEGELGNGDPNVLGSPTPLPVAGGHTFVKLAAGGSHTCALTSAGELYCWGGNFEGQLGIGTTDSSFSPVHVSPGTTFSEVVVGLWNTCALDGSGQAWCWGGNENGVLGSASPNAYETTPQPVSGSHTFTAIDEYGSFVCAIDDAAALHCWGRNDTGQLGDGTLADSGVPVSVDTTETFAAVATGAHHTCAVTTSGETLCWGDGSYGQLGHGVLELSSQPVAVLGGLSFTRLAAGSHFTCGELATGGVYCWGSADVGQLGGGYGGMGLLSAVPLPLAAPAN